MIQPAASTDVKGGKARGVVAQSTRRSDVRGLNIPKDFTFMKVLSVRHAQGEAGLSYGSLSKAKCSNTLRVWI